MLRLGALLLLSAQVAFTIEVKPARFLEQTTETRDYPYTRGYTPSTTPAPSSSNNDDDDDDMSNGFPALASKTKALIEQCIIDDYIQDEMSCGNNPYAGLVRLAFHDCATSDPSNTSFPGGCNAWMTKKCTQYDVCEFTAHENNGLQSWVTTLDAMYDNAKLNGKSMKTYLSRADFWHLASHYAVRKSSSQNVNITYWQGRRDPDMSWGPRFYDRLPSAFGWSEMQRVAHRNGMSDFSASALLGAHTLGSAHPSSSGYQGTWDSTPFVFDEQYWKTLLNLEWFIHDIHSTNSETQLPVTSTQYSLGPDNTDTSVMLFCDLEMNWNITGGCTVNHPTRPCQKAQTGLASALQAWATQPSTFYSAFAKAWESFSKWGCADCTTVPEYTGNVNCGFSNSYSHTCKQIYKGAYPSWKAGWNRGASGGDSSNSGGSSYNNGGSTTSAPASTSYSNGGSSTRSPATSTTVTTTAVPAPSVSYPVYPASTTTTAPVPSYPAYPAPASTTTTAAPVPSVPSYPAYPAPSVPSYPAYPAWRRG